MSMKKIAIVASEGGISCAYSVGAILALVEKFDLVNPYLVIGSSGCTSTFAYYVAGQYKSIRNIWENLLPSRLREDCLRSWRFNSCNRPASISRSMVQRERVGPSHGDI